MTPLKYLYYSGVVALDIFVAIVLLNLLAGASYAWSRRLIQIYFEEKEASLQRLADVRIAKEFEIR